MDNIGREHVNILGVKMNGASKNGLLRFLQLKLSEFDQNEAKKPIFIVTPNPEQIVLAQKDSEFKKILNGADISLPDGVGLILADKFLSLKSPRNRYLRFFVLLLYGITTGLSVLINRSWLEKDLKVLPGRDFFMDLIKLANKKGWRVYLLGGKGNTAQKTKEELERSYKRIRITAEGGPIINSGGYPESQSDKWEEEKVVKKINAFSPHLLFVAYGAPKQEKWLYRWLPKLNISTGMVVGGTFDYITGIQKLPPKIFRDMGMEWAWRLFKGNQNLKRLFTATIIFPFSVFWYKITHQIKRR
jgi:N-acetylglucosaminyldiphosphoundecaprenol N-acetyl-beta-D-mannosaminyltransferase